MADKINSFWILNLNKQKPKLLVKKGDLVERGMVLATVKKQKTRWLDLASALSVKPEHISKLMKVSLSSSIKKGDLLTEKKGFFGGKKEFFSPYSGVFSEIDLREGRIKIIGQKTKKIKSPVKGRVAQVDEKKIQIEFQALIFPGETKGEQRIWGELRALPNGESYFQLNSSFKNKILLVKKIDRMFISKAQALGIKALVTRPVKINNILLPIFIVKDYNNLCGFSGKTVLLDFPEKRILVCE